MHGKADSIFLKEGKLVSTISVSFLLTLSFIRRFSLWKKTVENYQIDEEKDVERSKKHFQTIYVKRNSTYDTTSNDFMDWDEYI